MEVTSEQVERFPVLVVEDDPLQRQTFAWTLQSAGYNTQEAAGGEEALAQLKVSQVSAIVLDNRMPGMTGVEVIQRLRADPATATIPILLVTADNDRDACVRGLQAGATDYMVKPIDAEELLARVQAHISGRARWASMLEAQFQERTAVIRSLSSLRPGSTAAQTAATVCQELSSIEHISGIAIFRFDETKVPRLLASHGGPGFGGLLSALLDRTGRALRDRAERGPWVDYLGAGSWVRGGLICCAPIRFGVYTAGLLVLAPDEAVAPGREDHVLAQAIDFAGAAAGLLGLTLPDQAEHERRHHDVSEVLRGNAFTPVFQPIVRLADGEIAGYEALTRFRDGVSPDRRFADASAVDLGPELELATIRSALEAASALPDSAFLSLNTSPGLIVNCRDELAELFHDPSNPLILELSEHDAVDDYDTLRTRLTQFDPSVQLSVDDAGAGFSTLRHVIALQPDFVKLDRTWVTGIAEDSNRQALVAGLSHFARATGCLLVAEGIETESELDTLSSLDVDLGQGYLLGRPALV